MKELECKDCYYNKDCIYLNSGNEKNCITKKYRTYCCPDCAWNPADVMDLDCPELFYYIEDGKAKPIHNSWIDDLNNKEYGAMIPNYQVLAMISTVKKVVIYPIRDKWYPEVDYYSGASGDSWRETHKCPKCNEEFVYWNSTI